MRIHWPLVIMSIFFPLSTAIAEHADHPICEKVGYIQLQRVNAGYICKVRNNLWQMHGRGITNQQVWRDLQSGLLWSAPANLTMSYREGHAACRSKSNQDTLAARADIKTKNFRLPTAEEFQAARNGGLLFVSPGNYARGSSLASIITSTEAGALTGHHLALEIFYGSPAYAVPDTQLGFDVRCVSEN